MKFVARFKGPMAQLGSGCEGLRLQLHGSRTNELHGVRLKGSKSKRNYHALGFKFVSVPPQRVTFRVCALRI